jgi:SAM-dependent methyltransferase
MSHQRDDLSGYYDRYWQEGVAGWTVQASVSKPISGLLRSIVASRSVLDYGGGDGQRYGQILREEAASCTVVDISPAMLAQRRAMGDEAISFDELLRSQDRIFDVLLVLEVLQHVVDPENVLVKLAEHVAPEGKVLISVPNAFSAVNRLRMLGGRLPASGVGARGVRGQTYVAPHIRFFDVASLKTLVSRAGFALDALFTDQLDLWRVTAYQTPRIWAYTKRNSAWFQLSAHTLYASCSKPRRH